jgi:protein-S-isoprenylcysteine O-methyltransferase Ste14
MSSQKTFEISPMFLAIIRRWAIKPEEAFLERRFGAEYMSYKQNVRRWV